MAARDGTAVGTADERPRPAPAPSRPSAFVHVHRTVAPGAGA